MYPLSAACKHLMKSIMGTTNSPPLAYNCYTHIFHTSYMPSYFCLHPVKCDKECNQYFTRFTKMSPKECPSIEMDPFDTGTQSYLNPGIQKALEKSIDPKAYIRHMQKKCGHSSYNMLNHLPLCIPQEGGKMHY